MIRVDVTLTDDTLMKLQAALSGFSGSNGGKIMPRTKAAFDMASKLIQKSWQNWAMGGSIAGASDIKKPNPNLARSIKIRRIGDFNISIGTDSLYMERIQNGVAEYDMKDTYPYGKKSRVSKRGVPYLIIPFRWGTPSGNGGGRAHFGNTITQEVYAILKSRKFKMSGRTSKTHGEKNYSGENIERGEYEWGDRVNDKSAGNMNGMVRMRSHKTSTYFTFRLISANSPANSWKRKAIPPNDVVSAVEKATRKDVEALLQEGLEQELGL